MLCVIQCTTPHDARDDGRDTKNIEASPVKFSHKTDRGHVIERKIPKDTRKNQYLY